MNVQKSVFTCFIISICYLNIFAQKTGINLIDTTDLKKHLSFIASDRLQGRTFGTKIKGLDIAANYIQAEVKKYGLREGFSGYFQPVPIVNSRADTINSYLEIKHVDGEMVFKTNQVLSTSVNVQTDIKNATFVFAGFGWRDSVSGYNDFQEIDLKGKLVLMVSGTPASFLKKEMPRFRQQESEKVKFALEKGAAGVCLIMSPLDKAGVNYSRLKNYLNEEAYRLEEIGQGSNSVYAVITAKTANSIPGIDNKLEEMLSSIAKSGKPASFIFKNLKADLQVVRKNEPANAKNVVAVVEGSDPELKKECVVFMAHYDHVGVDKKGDVFNGADDNGSGTVTLLELAQAFSSLHKKPARSIVFLCVTGEEFGMLGSQYYVSNPVYPLQKTKAAINIDMDGRVFEPRDTVWNKSPKIVKDFDGLYAVSLTPELKELNTKICTRLGLVPDYSLPAQFLYSSDHGSFLKNGIPILNLSTGYHADYHKATDEISRIRFDKMKRVTELCFLLGLELANQKD